MADPQPLAAAPVCYAFGPFLLDTATRRLRRDGEAVAITARVFDILAALVEQHGRVVEKDALIERVWGDVAVEEGNLARAISTLRRVLGESPDDHRYIVTLPGRGYQFVAPVQILGVLPAPAEPWPLAASAPAGPVRPWGRSRIAAAVMAAVLAAAGLVAIYLRYSSARDGAAATPGIVVLPFKSLGPVDDDYVAAGLTEEVTTRLSMVEAIRVIAHTSGGDPERPDKTAREIGEALDADYLIEGSVLWERDSRPTPRVRITAQLIRTADNSHVWSEAFDREVDELFKVQSEIAVRVVRELRGTLIAAERRTPEVESTTSPEAHQAYLRGVFYASRPDLSEENMDRSIRLFDRAVQHDPRYGEAQAALANAHALYYAFGYDSSRDRKELMRQALERAKREAPALPATVRAQARYWLTVGDPAKALEVAEAAERRWPNQPEIVASTADTLLRIGRWTDAAARLERVRDLDPRAAKPHASLALVLLGLRRYPEAQHAIDRSLAIEPDQGLAYIQNVWNTWLWKGDLDAARPLVDGLPPVHDWRLMELRFLQRLYERRYDAALATLAPWSGEWMRTFILARPVVLFEAQAHRLRGDTGAAAASFETACSRLEAEVAASPEDGRLRAALAVAYAGLGRKPDALRESQRALELMPYPQAFDTTTVREDVALAAAMLGEPQRALAEIATLLSTPAHFSVQLLRLDPRWDPLRSEPRYRELLASVKP